MGKNKIIVLVVCLVLGWGRIAGQPLLENQSVLESTTALRGKIVKLAESQLKVRERTGNNDGIAVERFLKSVNLRRGDAWCAAFMSWLHIELNIPNPESGYSPNWFTANVVYRKNKPRITKFTSRPGQVIGLWFESKGRIAHVGMITGEDRLHYLTIEGNTNAAGSREGDGVYRKIRKKESIYAISDFVGYKEILKAIK